jgi:micrococcal nuclease
MRLKITYLLLFSTFVCFGTSIRVTRIIDGDTFETETGEKVRLIGINAPEISDMFGEEAKQYLSELIENKTVNLQSDNISKDRDQYQRLLRYVILDGVDINKKMVSDGFAFAYLKYHFSYSREYKLAQIEAREANKGIWGNSNKETNIKVQENKETTLRYDFSPKAYFIGSIILLLISFGFYNYFKK